MRKIQLYFYGSMSILCFVASCIGCANIHYLTPTGEEFNYTRLGIQKIQGFKMSKDSNGLIHIEFESQEGTTGDLAETMKNISEALLKVP